MADRTLRFVAVSLVFHVVFAHVFDKLRAIDLALREFQQLRTTRTRDW